MPFRFSQKIVYQPEAAYHKLIQKVSTKLQEQEEVIATFQVGSVSHPGISDIDLVCLFKDDMAYHHNPRQALNEAELDLLVHSVFGLPFSHWKSAQRFTFFHNIQQLTGEPIALAPKDISEVATTALKTQTALEYLVKMYITLSVQLKYGVIKLRSFLLEVKAIRYDLEFLGMESGPLWNCVKQIIEMRGNWFSNTPSLIEMDATVTGFYNALEDTLKEVLATHTLYLPDPNSEKRISRYLALRPGETIGWKHQGIILPSFMALTGKRYFSLQNRLNNFYFYCPMAPLPEGDILQQRSHYIIEAVRYNRQMLPFFSPLTSSLAIY